MCSSPLNYYLDQSFLHWPVLLKRIKASILKERKTYSDNTHFLSIIYLSSVHLSSRLSNRYCLFLCFHQEEQFINGKTKVEPLLLELEALLPKYWCWSIVRIHCILSLILTISSKGSFSSGLTLVLGNCYFYSGVAKSPSKNSKICEARTHKKSTLSVLLQIVWSTF